MSHSIISNLLQMSLQASLLICAVMVIRLFIKTFPKIYACILWLLVLFRLLCPVFIINSYSPIPQVFSGERTPAGEGTPQQTAEPSNSLTNNNTPINNPSNGYVNKPGGYEAPAAITDTVKKFAWPTETILLVLWLVGTIGMVIFHTVQYQRIKRRTAKAVHLEENIWECDGIHTPFVMGCLQPRIYLPLHLEGIERQHILSHERQHIRHFDPQFRLLGILALCLHWWNPLVWLAVHTMNQDREMFCDESVLHNADMETRKQYSNTLLQYALKQSQLSVTLSFGESNTENRIRHILKYHKPKVAISCMLLLLIAGCAFVFLTVPGPKEIPAVATGSTDGSTDGKEIQTTVKTGQPGDTTAEPSGSTTGSTVGETDPGSAAGSENTVITDPKEFAELVLSSLGKDDKKALANLIKYPITVSIDGKQVAVYKPDDFIADYDRIVTEEFKLAVLATITRELFMNQYGVNMGNGAIWFEKFDESGYRIYAINNGQEPSVKDGDALKTGWTEQTQQAGMTAADRDAWYARIVKDIPHAEGNYELMDLAYEDLDKNGSKDLLLQVKLAGGAITPDSYPGAYVCIYMNDDPVYLKAYDSSLFFGFLSVLHGDVDRDGHQEILCSISTGGNGGAGSSEKMLLKYRNHTLEQMQFPGDKSELFADGTDVGYAVQVLFGATDNQYKAVFDSLGRTVSFQAKPAVKEDGSLFSPNRRENEQAGGNCRGYADFSIVSRNGREYLLAKEYLYGEGGINHCVGWATFLLDWDKNGKPSVLEFGVDSLAQ